MWILTATICFSVVMVTHGAKFCSICPEDCTCLRGPGTFRVECSDYHGYHIPLGLCKSTTHLLIRRSNITSIRQEDLAGLPHLRVLAVTNSPLDIIENGSFDNTLFITHINLDNNSITNIPKNLFRKSKNLLEISFAGNKLENVPSSALPTLSSLQVLVLDRNKFKSVSRHAFRGMSSLRLLSLRHLGALTFVEQECFDGLVNLDTLYISHNPQLRSINSLLTTKDSGRKPSSLSLPSLRNFHLNNNCLSVINKNLFIAMPNLKYACVYGNQLKCTGGLKWIRMLMDKEASYPWIRTWISGPEAVFCADPRDMKYRQISVLMEEDFKAKYQRLVKMSRKGEDGDAVIRTLVATRHRRKRDSNVVPHFYINQDFPSSQYLLQKSNAGDAITVHTNSNTTTTVTTKPHKTTTSVNPISVGQTGVVISAIVIFIIMFVAAGVYFEYKRRRELRERKFRRLVNTYKRQQPPPRGWNHVHAGTVVRNAPLGRQRRSHSFSALSETTPIVPPRGMRRCYSGRTSLTVMEQIREEDPPASPKK